MLAANQHRSLIFLKIGPFPNPRYDRAKRAMRRRLIVCDLPNIRTECQPITSRGLAELAFGDVTERSGHGPAVE